MSRSLENAPVDDFISSKSINNRAKILGLLSFLEEKGPNLPRPYADLLVDGIHELRIKILEERNKLGISQKDLANKAHVTQQQLSKVENGINCNITTFLKVCGALGLKINFENKSVRI